MCVYIYIYIIFTFVLDTLYFLPIHRIWRVLDLKLVQILSPTFRMNFSFQTLHIF